MAVMFSAPLRAASVVFAALAARLGLAARALRGAAERRRRRSLDRLSDHLLDDIGVSRAELERAMRMGSWRD